MLRIRGQQEVRIFYCFHENSACLLSGFIKQSQKMPKKDLEKALDKFRSLTGI
ncbi:MAG: type II toxin-antitoxin system RelE/ParE family toxin [Candidatus Doudnabacteria bacterium]|nr:type II toxin-antitoxin system RelE/ParE family toxin [Candidatus Doudnabacteria bacterium]